ncbi:DUF6916 family protein [Altererythrobacter sp. C41]|uniref:DUF6916 family protein n=1 Tax=Altererythrobacter sp. C41 TaxID=2806021 RepID=UPI0019338A58|nr:hypothetical protein [Altererythrobacter sp. C41]MBM0169820.1 hypothetical protein [Altererythrobacter sp. C41]
MSNTECIGWSDFAGREGRAYTLQAGGDLHEVTLEHAKHLGGAIRAGGSFRLAFRGPCEPVLPQAVYRLQGEDFDGEIFLVPISRDDTGTLYEAIFN